VIAQVIAQRHTMQAPTFVYLASRSPRRVQLLEQLGVAHRPLLPDADEDAEALEALRPGELPQDYVQRVARAKLAAAWVRLAQRGLPVAPILAADTTVALGRQILGKPDDAGHARQMLQRLSGRTHRVLSAVALGCTPRRSGLALCISRVRFAELPAAIIERYVGSGEPFGKAGAYAVQGPIAAWIAHLQGSYSGVMGLPLFETAQLLRRARVPLAA